ncbi:hypothetical protein FH969_00090 [Miniimonas arenae]|uniref:Uncharacterized protein n=1 Tax=Miniimonas arenae TaxID=676201 RepID=A0A5C5BHQ9_9MICO|nr:hypothetical protein [Miniimonas arenae]TNU77222.1 hypothetical protein FH969_00090 [Miniimonas arenae]
MIVRPIHRTSELARWRELAVALGGVVTHESDGWIELTYGSGALALHHAEAGAPDDGVTDLRLLVEEDSLPALERRLGPALATHGARLERRVMGHGEELRVIAADGAVVTFDPVLAPAAEPPAAHSPADPAPAGPTPTTAVQAIWYTPVVQEAADLLETLGLRRRIASDSGGWVDLRADGGGLAAVHAGRTVGTELAFEIAGPGAVGDAGAGDGDGGLLHELHARLTASGHDAALIDESYGVTLRVANPDAPDDVDARIWVSEWQGELYGYTVAHDDGAVDDAEHETAAG